MRLIHTTDLYFREFDRSKAPTYAVVSHRWDSDEVTYQDFLNQTNREGYGWTKVIQACRIARLRNITWLWIDTCCLDKTSSAELSESINSMFKYYKWAKQCYAFLPDVDVDASDPAFEDQLHGSVWFTRGWTLQELLASPLVNFFNAHFKLIGVKTRDSPFCNEISKITGIGREYLQNPKELLKASIAERMRWAALRDTTRVEDRAYSLLGIFDVNMPLLYGEGRKAFTRLQLEIIRKSEDESIFAWHTDLNLWQGLLAPSPYAFAGEDVIETKDIHQRAPFSMTNKGIQLSLAVLADFGRKGTTLLLPLNCIRVVHHGESTPPTHYQLALRVHVKSLPDPHNSGLRVLVGRVVRERTREQNLVSSHISHRQVTVGYTRFGRKMTKLQYASRWKCEEHDCSGVVGIFPRASAGAGQTHAIFFQQDGV